MVARFVLKCAKESAGEIPLPNLCIGTWSWGDRYTWQHAGPVARSQLNGTWDACLRRRLTFFDTAEIYGFGESERIIGQMVRRTVIPEETGTKTTGGKIKNDLSLWPGGGGEINASKHTIRREDLVLASKWSPFPLPAVKFLRPEAEGVTGPCRDSLARLGPIGGRMDLYQVHGPTHQYFWASIDRVAAGLAGAVDKGFTRAVGVSNYSVDEVARMDDALRRQGLRLGSNQVEFGLLRTLPEKSGLLAECRRRGILLMAYSPLGMGWLSGKYSEGNPPPGYGRVGNGKMERLRGLLDVLRRTASRHSVKPSAVALKWVMQKGAIPIEGVRYASQVAENARAVSDEWSLTEAEMAELEEQSFLGKTTTLWQHG